MNTIHHRFLTLLVLLCLASAITSCGSATEEDLSVDDQYTVTGTVTDRAGAPLVGASILIAGTTTGTISDVDGSFELRASGSDVNLQVRYTGYLEETITVNEALGEEMEIALRKE